MSRWRVFKMRKILLTTFGSYGDLHPYIAIARVLKANGDDVTIATHAEYREQVERIGVRFVIVKPGLDEVGPQEDWAAKANHGFRGTEFILRTLVLPYLNDSYHNIKAAAAGHDLIISHVLTFAAPVVAEELGIPWVSSALQPSPFFSAYDPPALGFLTILPRLKFLGPRFMGWFLRQLARPTRSWLTPIDVLRSRTGLPASSKNALIDGYSPYGTLALFPAAFAPAQPDWPAGVRQIGFPLFDEETTTDVSTGVRQFLAGGSRPVVFTLGTAIVMMETTYFEIAYAAVKKLGLRAVFLVGKKPRGIPALATTDPDIHISNYEPFSGLFPHASVIVHQCGIGTTAQALASGRPQVLVPFAHDQPDNARRVVALGAGVAIPARRLNVARLVAALEKATTSKMIADASGSLVARLQVQGFDQRLLDAVAEIMDSATAVTPVVSPSVDAPSNRDER
jgi:rhamnosyltransferase subunit B